MKLNLFLLSLLAVLYASKAGPLRSHSLQKRAAFYIANETACVVDNIVYTNGDPIPTDDPCESCKCRPPGFACVLKECQVKPGCRAVRREGYCCPEYLCDAPSKDSSVENNALPPLNLLPILNDESVLPGDLPQATAAPESSQEQTDPPQITSVVDEEKPVGKEGTDESSKVQTTESSIPVTEEVKIADPETEEENSEKETPVEEDPVEVSSPDKKEVEGTKVLFNSDSEIKNDGESTEATHVKEVTEEDKSTKVSDSVEPGVQELREAEPQAVASETEPVENEGVSVTEKQPGTESTSADVQPTEKPVKNSAADNSKSLKLPGDENDASEGGQNEASVDGELGMTIAEKQKETLNNRVKGAAAPTETSKKESAEIKVDESEFKENVAEESQSEPQTALLFSQDDKVVKKETAETVTIVVHVREKTKPQTETDFETEKSTSESTTGAPQDALLKSSDDLSSKETEVVQDAEENTSTGKNFEVFPDSSTKVNENESVTNAPVTEVHNEKVEARSEENTSTVSSEEKKTTESDSKSEELPATTQNANDDHSELDKEARANEEIVGESKVGPKTTEVPTKESKTTEVPIQEPKTTVVAIQEPKATEVPVQEPKATEAPVEEPKESEVTAEKPKVTEIRIEQPNSNVALKIEIITDSGEAPPKAEDSKTEEPKEDEVTEESKPEERSVENEAGEKIQEPKPQDKVEEPKLEDKVEESKTEDKVEESKTEDKVEELKPEDKVEESKTEEAKSEPQENTEESKSEERSDDVQEKAEVTSESNVPSSKPEEKPEVATEQVTEVPKQTETPKSTE